MSFLLAFRLDRVKGIRGTSSRGAASSPGQCICLGLIYLCLCVVSLPVPVGHSAPDDDSDTSGPQSWTLDSSPTMKNFPEMRDVKKDARPERYHDLRSRAKRGVKGINAARPGLTNKDSKAQPKRHRRDQEALCPSRSRVQLVPDSTSMLLFHDMLICLCGRCLCETRGSIPRPRAQPRPIPPQGASVKPMESKGVLTVFVPC